MKKELKGFSASHHFIELDSLRGLAALSVLFGHFTNVFRASTALEFARNTPFFLSFAAHEAVMLFFVLSGFVLSLQFMKGRPVGFGSFAIKRIFRIYLPYLVAILLAIGASALFYSGRIEALSEWFNFPWSAPFSWKHVFEHVAFLGFYRADRYDPVIWSLVEEMRISLVFPFLAALMMRLNTRQNFVLAGSLSFFGIVSSYLLTKFQRGTQYDLMTFHYAGMFVLGYLIALHRNAIHAFFAERTSLERVAVFLTGVLLYTYARCLPFPLRYFMDVPIAIGACIFVIAAYCFPGMSEFLRRRPVHFLGKISYSLYLYHAIVLLTTIHLFYGRVPLSILLLLSLAGTLVVATLSYWWVELPSIALGKKLSGRFEGRGARAAAKAATATTALR
jgi:peptidoglycan/LPS O-acetylase OafA/YrhL